MARSGWDNVTFHVGDAMLARLPSASEYALAVDKEHRWLPALAPHLPLPLPVPLAKGRPGADYPFAWSVYQWLHGEPATADRIDDPVCFALDVAEFLAALRSVDTADRPQPGKHNWFRGASLRTYHARGRGWALWKTLVTYAQTIGRADEQATNARRVLDGIWAGPCATRPSSAAPPLPSWRRASAATTATSTWPPPTISPRPPPN